MSLARETKAKPPPTGAFHYNWCMHEHHRTYDTAVRTAAYCDMLPEDIARQIPKSTLSDMRRRDPSYLWGGEWAGFIREMDLMREIATCRAALKTASAVLRVVHLVRSLKVPFHRVAKVKDPEVRKKIVTTVERLKGCLPLEKTVRLLGLTRSSFSSWSRNLFACISSPRSLCRKAYPNQLTHSEVNIIRAAFSDPAHLHWPAISVAWHLIHSGKLSAHVATITRYARLLGLTVLRANPHRSRKRGSIAADGPNKVWHLDATYVRALDNSKTAVQLLQDNFSRKIIAWKVASSVSWHTTTEVIRSGYSSLTRIPTEKIDLIVDGGPENNNTEVEALLEQIPLRKLIAQVQVTFSNSMIEAVNKTLKYRYLFRTPIPDSEHVEPTVAFSVTDFNDRPHYDLFGLTPNQAHAGALFDKAAYHERIQRAGRHRIEVNRHSCPPCVPMGSEMAPALVNEGILP